MGHRVNPLFFRLGLSKDWSYQLRDPLLMNIFIYRLIRSLVFQYSAPYTSYQIKRNSDQLHNFIRKPRFYPPNVKQMTKAQAFEYIAQKKKVIRNPFRQASFTFSHINVSSNPNLFISIFLFDEAAERYRVHNRLPEKYFFCLSGKYYHRSHRWYSFFQKYHFHASAGNRGKRILRSWFFKGFRNFVNARIYIKRLKTSIHRPKKQVKRVTQFDRIFRSKIPKKKFVSKKGLYNRLRRLPKLKQKKYDQRQFSEEEEDDIKKYPTLLRIGLSKVRSTRLIFKQIAKYKKRMALMRKEALTYQMRFLPRTRKRKLIKRLTKKKVNKSKIKKSKKSNKKKIYNKRLSLLWKTLYRVKTANISKQGRKLVTKSLEIEAKNRNSKVKFRSRMERILSIANARLARPKRKPYYRDYLKPLTFKTKFEPETLDKELLASHIELNKINKEIEKEIKQERNKKTKIKGVIPWVKSNSYKRFVKYGKIQIIKIDKLGEKTDDISKAKYSSKIRNLYALMIRLQYYHRIKNSMKKFEHTIKNGFLSIRRVKKKSTQKNLLLDFLLKFYKRKRKPVKLLKSNSYKGAKRNQNPSFRTRARILRSKLHKLFKRKRIVESTFLKKRYPIWLINSLSFTQIKKSFIHRHLLKDLKILKFLIRYLKFYNKMLSKRRILFFNLIINCLSSILVVLPKGKMANRLYIFMHLCYIYLYSFRYLYFQYNKKIFQSRFIRFNLLSKLVIFSLKKIYFNSINKLVTLRYYGLHNRNYNAQFLLNYLLVKLGQYYKIQQILNPLVNNLKRMPFIKGFRFIVSGRLTRKERAFFIVKSVRRMPLSSHDCRIDSAADFKIMKFGVVGIKIYLLYTETPPFYYFFEFKNKI
jgi:hypothetical protein